MWQAYELSDVNFGEVSSKFVLVNREVEKLRSNADKKKKVRNIIRESVKDADARHNTKGVREQPKKDSCWVRFSRKAGIQNFRSKHNGVKNPDYYGPLDKLCWLARVPCWFMLPFVFLPGGVTQRAWHLFGFYLSLIYATIKNLHFVLKPGRTALRKYLKIFTDCRSVN